MDKQQSITEIKTTKKIMVRQVLPNDFEFKKRDSINNKDIKISLPVDEAVKIRNFTHSEIRNLDAIKITERDDFKDFCNKNLDFIGIFHAQFEKGQVLDDKQLSALDFMQDIKETDRRLIYQKQARISLKDFIARLTNFVSNNPNKVNIPVLDLDAKEVYELEILRQKVMWLIENGFKKVIVVYRGRQEYEKAWYFSMPRLSKYMEAYVFEIPLTEGKFSPLFYAFYMGANKACHKINLAVGSNKKPIGFLERTWEKKPIDIASVGLADYNGMNRKQFLQMDGRKKTIYPFSRWDTIVQANEYCQKDLMVSDLKKVLILKKAISYFS